MSKETTIIFVYDTELLKREEDDPNSAILYFFPTWVSEQQKTALCGQLIGTVMCLRSILAMPRLVSLQTGKFFLIENGRYILVVGTDRNIPDWVLEYRATLIYSLVQFFHKDFITLAQRYENENLISKLYHIFDTYLKLLFLGGSIFTHMPLLDLSKTENNIITNVKVFLDKCKNFPNVLGGMVLYHNKVVNTQLSAQTSKKITFSDPFRIKNPAELTDLNYEIPLGVKLLQVHISSDEYQDLFSKVVKLDDEDSSDAVVTPVPPSTSSLKRDTSLFSISVPEDATFSPRRDSIKQGRINKKSRPNSLNLKSCSLESAGDYHLGTRKTPITPYWGQSPVVCTPMTETKPFVDKSDVRASKERIWQISMDFRKMNIHAVPNKSDQMTCFSCPLDIYTKHLEKAKKLCAFVRDALQKASLFPTSSLTSIPNNLSNQYSNCKHKKSINLKRWKSISDPLFPWFKGEQLAASQYYVEDMLGDQFFVEMNKKEEFTFRELVTERKKSLTLPIKPHNASEAQKADMRSPGGYRTPLMNKLAMANAFEPPKEILAAPFVTKEESRKTEKPCELEKCILFMYGYRDIVLVALLTEECIRNRRIIEKLRELCIEELPTLERQMQSCIDPPKTAASSTYSILSLDSQWDTLQRSGMWDTSDLNDLTLLHGNFNENRDIIDIYLRKPESVLYGHRETSSEVFYHEAAPVSNGLLPPNDVLGTVYQTAKQRLEKDHNLLIK